MPQTRSRSAGSGNARRTSSASQSNRRTGTQNSGTGSHSVKKQSTSSRKKPVRKQKPPLSPMEKSMLAVLAVLCLLLVVLGGIYLSKRYTANQEEMAALLDVDTFYEGVFVDGISLGGKTVEEARNALLTLYEDEFNRISLNLNMNGQTVRTLTREDIDIQWTLEDILAEAHDIGRSGTRYNRYNLVKSLPTNPRYLTTLVRFNTGELESEIRSLADSLYQPPIDAAFLGVDTTQNTADSFFRYNRSLNGRQVDGDALWQMVQEAIQSHSYEDIEIPYNILEPSVTLSDVNKGQQLLGTYTTEMIQNGARISNIKLAATKVNGTILESGEIFSYNKCLGPRTEEAGYKVAGVITKGLSDTGLGGGICQLSSTLYVAAMRADLHMAERTHHSYVLSYIPAGLDATVNWDSGVDMRITNSRTSKVYFIARIEDLKVIVEIYGTPADDGITTDLTPKIIYTTQPKEVKIIYDESVPVGEPVEQKEHLGVEVDVYKTYFNPDGTVLKEEFMYKDQYSAVQPTIRMNPLDMFPGGGELGS